MSVPSTTGNRATASDLRGGGSSPQVVEDAQTLWGVALITAGCPQCKQVYLLPPGSGDRLCPACGGARLFPQPAQLRPEPPELLAPFVRAPQDLPLIFKEFTSGIWLRSSDFTQENLAKRAVPVLWPMWLVDCNVVGLWRGEMGFDYQVKSSQESYAEGRWQTHEVTETRIRWEPRLGQMVRHYDNIPVPALVNHQQLIDRSGAYLVERGNLYHPDRLVGSILFMPGQENKAVWPLAQEALNRSAAEDCRKASNAQHQRSVMLDASYESPNWTQLLLPMYISYYLDDAGAAQLVTVNGQSGKISGLRLSSQRKGWQTAGIITAIAAGLFMIGLLCLILGAVLPPLAVFGAVVVLVAIFTTLGALIPAIYPWQWNRQQQSQKIHRA